MDLAEYDVVVILKIFDREGGEKIDEIELHGEVANLALRVCPDRSIECDGRMFFVFAIMQDGDLFETVHELHAVVDHYTALA